MCNFQRQFTQTWFINQHNRDIILSNNDADLFYGKPVLQVMLNSRSKNSNLIYCELLIQFNHAGGYIFIVNSIEKLGWQVPWISQIGHLWTWNVTPWKTSLRMFKNNKEWANIRSFFGDNVHVAHFQEMIMVLLFLRSHIFQNIY